MRNDDIKKRLRQSASSIEVPDNLQATLSKLPDSLPIVEPKRKSKPAWLYPLLGGSAAVLLLGVAIGVPLGLRSNKVDIGGGSTPPGVSYNLTQKEMNAFGYQALSTVAMVEDLAPDTRKGMRISEQLAEQVADEVVSYMDIVASFSEKEAFAFLLGDDSGFEILFNDEAVYDLDFTETPGEEKGEYLYEGTIRDLRTGEEFALIGKKEIEQGEEEIEVAIYLSSSTWIESKHEMESEEDEIENSYEYSFYSNGKHVKTIEYEVEIEGMENETELTVVEGEVETSVSFEYLGDLSRGYECEYSKEGPDIEEVEAEMKVSRNQDGTYTFAFADSDIIVVR